MRKRPSGVDKDIDVYEFAFGIKEIEILEAICTKTWKIMPEVMETMPLKSRIRNMRKGFNKLLNEVRKEHEKSNR